MTRVIKCIIRTAVAMLAAVSVSAFAAAPDAPNFLMHQASVNLKVSNQEGLDLKIDKKTIKTKEVILKNVTTTSGKPLRLSDNPFMFKDVTVRSTNDE